MKHLRRFSESLKYNWKFYEDDFYELKDFCETTLAYLLDEDFHIEYVGKFGIRIIPISDNNFITVQLYGPLVKESDDTALIGSRYSTWYWNDVKDYYIPLIQLLKSRYRLSEYISFRIQTGRLETYLKSYTLEQVVNDKIELDKPIFSISVEVKKL